MAPRLAHKRLTDEQKALAVSALTKTEVQRLPLALRKYRRRQVLNQAQRRYHLKLHIYGTYKIANDERRKLKHKLAQRIWRAKHYEQDLEINRKRRRRLIKLYGACSEWAIALDKWIRNKEIRNQKEKELLLKYADRLLLEPKLQARNTRRSLTPVPKIRELRLLARQNGSLDLQFLPSKTRASKRRPQGHGKKV